MELDQHTSSRSLNKAFAYQKLAYKPGQDIKEFNDDPDDIDIPLKKVEDNEYDYDKTILDVQRPDYEQDADPNDNEYE